MRPQTFIVFALALLILALSEFISRIYVDAAFLRFLGPGLFVAILSGYATYNLSNLRDFLGSRGARLGASSGLTVLLGLLIVVGAAFLSTKPRFNMSWDLTQGRTNTLASQSKNVIANLRAEKVNIKISAFFESDEVRGTFDSLMRLYQREWPELSVTYTDPIKEKTTAQALDLNNPNTVIFQRGEQSYRITTFNEEKITTALLNVSKKTTKKIYFIEGHGEAAITNKEAKGYLEASDLLRKNKFTVASTSLLQEERVPADADLVIIAGPKYEISDQEIKMLGGYLDTGGAMLVMADAVDAVSNINRLISDYGLKFNDDYLILRPDDPRVSVLGQNIALVTEFDRLHPVTREFSKGSVVAVPLANTRSLAVRADSDARYKTDSLAKTAQIILRVDNVRERKDLKGISKDRLSEGIFDVLAICQSSTQDSEQVRLAVVGSAQLASNFGGQTAQNFDLFLNLVNYLVRDESYISIRPKADMKSTLDLTSTASQISLQFMTYLYPILFLLAGMIYWMRRRKA